MSPGRRPGGRPPYIVTHGAIRQGYGVRHQAMLDAITRMEMTLTDPAGQHLADIEAIKQLKARYFRLLDTKQWAEWGQVFTEDVRMEVPEAAVELDGREAVVDGVSVALAGTTTTHHGHMPEIEITGPDSARGIWAMFDYVEWPRAEDGARVGLQGYGHYHEDYARQDGIWRISWTRLERLRIDPLA